MKNTTEENKRKENMLQCINEMLGEEYSLISALNELLNNKEENKIIS